MEAMLVVANDTQQDAPRHRNQSSSIKPTMNAAALTCRLLQRHEQQQQNGAGTAQVSCAFCGHSDELERLKSITSIIFLSFFVASYVGLNAWAAYEWSTEDEEK